MLLSRPTSRVPPPALPCPPQAAYTFDAGPNAVLYVLRDDVPLVLKLMMRGFPAPEEESKMGAFVDDEDLLARAAAAEVPYPLRWTEGVTKVPGVKHVYHTSVSCDSVRLLAGCAPSEVASTIATHCAVANPCDPSCSRLATAHGRCRWNRRL